ncbi:MAG: YybH family protein [Mucilaginibacter sp.]
MNEQIKKLVTTYFEKLKAADAGSIAMLYSEDGVMMPPIFPTISGRGEVKKFYTMALGKKKFNMNSEIVEIIEDTNIAMVRTLSKGTSVTIETNETVNEDSKELFILRKEGTEWKIARLIVN